METVEVTNRNERSYSEKPNSSNTISRQAAIDATNKLIDRFERILRDIRETNEDESVCGMCEYDGAFIGESGDWCNECPGFNRADCFKLSDECRKRWLKELNLPAAQPERKNGSWNVIQGDIVICSECGMLAPKLMTGCLLNRHLEPNRTNFCPNCGADMRGEGEQE